MPWVLGGKWGVPTLYRGRKRKRYAWRRGWRITCTGKTDRRFSGVESTLKHERDKGMLGE